MKLSFDGKQNILVILIGTLLLLFVILSCKACENRKCYENKRETCSEIVK
jgi:hypothetical protein